MVVYKQADKWWRFAPRTALTTVLLDRPSELLLLLPGALQCICRALQRSREARLLLLHRILPGQVAEGCPHNQLVVKCQPGQLCDVKPFRCLLDASRCGGRGATQGRARAVRS